MRRRWLVLGGVVLMLGAVGAGMASSEGIPAPAGRFAPVTKGDFTVVVNMTGELRAKRSVQITAPIIERSVGMFQMKIVSLVPEGTLVKAGDIVAELDRAALAGKMSEADVALHKAEALHEQATLDTTLTLSRAREEIRATQVAVEEARLARDQSAYEPRTVQRQAEIAYEKAQRGHIQSKKDYETRAALARAKMREANLELERQRAQVAATKELMNAFTVRAPAAGMVIYKKDWDGKRRGVGSQVSPFDPGVATIPDLTEMESVGYVNEIDVGRLTTGQRVEVTIDADRAKSYAGIVESLGGMGEDRSGVEGKLFELVVRLTATDTTLRPGATTTNRIETLRVPNALSIPVDAVTIDRGETFAYRRVGARAVRRRIETGTRNGEHIVIVRGLSERDEVLLAPPERLR